MQIKWNNFSVHFILKSKFKRILDEIFKFFRQILLQLQKIKTIFFFELNNFQK